MILCLLPMPLMIARIMLLGLFTKLGFTIYPDKSILEPTQEIEFFLVLINSLTMTVRLSATKATKVESNCQELLGSGKTTIRHVAHVIGVLVSSLPAVQYGHSIIGN